MRAEPSKSVTRLLDKGKEKLGNLGEKSCSKLGDVVGGGRRLIEKASKEFHQAQRGCAESA